MNIDDATVGPLGGPRPAQAATGTRDGAAPGGEDGGPGDAGRDDGARDDPGRGVPEATVARLPQYLRALTALAERGTETVSSEALAAAVGVGSAKLRKDLSHLGSYGTRGVGYEVGHLLRQISAHLGLTQHWNVVIIGIGNLGRSLAGYGGFASRGFGVVGLYDDSPAVVGECVNGHVVRPLSEFEVPSAGCATIAVLAVPAAVAQRVCDLLVSAGVTSILNFAPVVLHVPEGVHVRRVDLASELQILAFHEQRKAAPGRTTALVDGATLVDGGRLGSRALAGQALDGQALEAALQPSAVGTLPRAGATR